MIRAAFLRAVNVGGTGLLRMEDLRAMARAAGLGNPRTLGASGNLIFESDQSDPEVRGALEPPLSAHLGRSPGLVLRTAGELRSLLADLPFPTAEPSRTMVILFDRSLPPDALDSVAGQATEELRLGPREIHIHYPDGLGRSRLRIPSAEGGTARNLNTLRGLLKMADTA
jgi:uncharacterized protein (DUF1697 family)